MSHVFACLVHERQESIVDLVRNLSHLAADATILLYNGGSDQRLLQRRFRLDGREPVVHPHPRPQRWGALHEFALDCMRFALQELEFDALTIVDSDQLLLRAGYCAQIDAFLRAHPRAGLLGNVAGPQPPTTRMPAAVSAWRERELWMPYLRHFPAGEARFPHWIFWPATVFTAPACHDLVRAFDDPQLTSIMRMTRIFATEEIVLPTLVALHGHEVLLNPGSLEFVQYNVLYTRDHLRGGMARPNVFWAHPIPRRYDHPLRQLVRAQLLESRIVPKGAAMTDRTAVPLLLTVPILERMRSIEGWLSDSEADLLIAGLARAVSELPGPYAVVEVGSYHGRSTTVLGGVLHALRADGHVYAIDPHHGEVGALDQGLIQTRPTLDAFTRNVAAAGLSDVVKTVPQRSYEVSWDQPIAFMLIDGLHDYANVSRDFAHFEGNLGRGAYVAFHDYADYYPGVRSFVDEVLAGGEFEEVTRSETMILLRRIAAGAGSERIARIEVDEPEAAPAPDNAAGVVAEAAAGAWASAAATPLVSCVMPTYGRPELALDAVHRFLRQDLACSELVVVDDSPVSLAGRLPDDARVVHVRLSSRRTIGAKRNIGCDAARAEVLANWDDDDWYALHRLRYQLTALRRSGADVVGLNRLLYLEPATGHAWRYCWPSHGRPWVHDATLAFTRAFWRRNPFPNTSMGIDCGLLWTPTRKHVVALGDERFYVGIIHPANTSPKHTSHGSWSAHPVADVEALIGDDSLRQLGQVAGVLA
jgi:hypothetical protein